MKEIICKDTGEIANNYEEYLKTKHWIRLKKAYAKDNKYECTMCDNIKDLHLHHMTYENIGNENNEDLVYLCGECHKLIHKHLNSEDTKVLGRFIENIHKIDAIPCKCRGCFHYTDKREKRDGRMWDADMCRVFYIRGPHRIKCKRYSPKLKDGDAEKMSPVDAGKTSGESQKGWENVKIIKADLSKYRNCR